MQRSKPYLRSKRLAALAACLATGALVAPAAATAEDPELAAAPGSGQGGSPQVYTAVNAKRVFFDKPRKAEFWYRVEHEEPVDVTIELVDTSSGAAVRTWQRTVENGQLDRVRSNGVVRGQLLRESRYSFRVTASDSSGARTQSTGGRDRDRDSFNLWLNRFPVRGRHDYGGAQSGFGAGRGGRSHQGHDVFAACGTRLDAARGGRVQYAGYHGAAGHYLVIDGRKSRRDYAYMHLRRKPRVQTGDRVRTGQVLGRVGDSGNASGCHLHFEIWRGPGWYEGGQPIDPLGYLRHWDSFS